MELYEQIRREYEFGVGSIIGVARKLGVHRRMVGGGAERSSGAAQEDRTSGGEDGRSGVVDRCDS